MNILSPPAEYLRAAQKDAEYSGLFKQSFLSALEALGQGALLRQHTWAVSLFAESLYLLCNLFFSSFKVKQTPGEEYVNVALADYNKVCAVRRVLVSTNYPKAAYVFRPSTLKLLTFILLKTLSPYYIKRVASQLKDPRVLIVLEDLEALVLKSHLGLFFYYGIYYNLSKRLSALVYTKLSRAQAARPLYRNLSYFLILQVLVLLYKVYKRWIVPSSVEEPAPPSGSSSGFCVLCLGSFKQASCTPCGHLYCWVCIMSSVQVNAQCPICRQPSPPQLLVQLRNF